MTIAIDLPALELLEALHAGALVTLDVRATRTNWRVRPRMMIPCSLYDDGEYKLVPLDGADLLLGTYGEQRRVDIWAHESTDLPLAAGLQLIRQALAVRHGNKLLPTAAGRAIAQERIGNGIAFDADEQPTVSTAGPAAAYRVSEQPAVVSLRAPIACSQNVTLLRSRDGVYISLHATGKKLSGLIPAASARAIGAFLTEAGKASTPITTTFGTVQITLGDRLRPLRLSIVDTFDEAIVDLPSPEHRIFRDILREMLKPDGASATIEPVSVQWLSIDGLTTQ